MKTTLDQLSDLMRAPKIRADEGNCELKDVIGDLLRLELAKDAVASLTNRQRARLPLDRCAPRPRPGEETTPERLDRVLIEEGAEGRRVARCRQRGTGVGAFRERARGKL